MRLALLTTAALAVLTGGCLQTSERNPFLTLTETFGVTTSGDESETGSGGGATTVGGFRREMTVTFGNAHPELELNVNFAAWVNVNSIRAAEQQDALLDSGYVPLTRELRLGSVFTLPPGTFVFDGPGQGGATAVRLGAADPIDDNTVAPTTAEFTIITPDVILVFMEPPVSCDSVAFVFSENGDILTDHVLGSGATGVGPRKTLAQIDVYQCDPLRPGLFLKPGGGVREANEFLEGENVRFDFFAGPDADGNFANVTIS